MNWNTKFNFSLNNSDSFKEWISLAAEFEIPRAVRTELQWFKSTLKLSVCKRQTGKWQTNNILEQMPRNNTHQQTFWLSKRTSYYCQPPSPSFKDTEPLVALKTLKEQQTHKVFLLLPTKNVRYVHVGAIQQIFVPHSLGTDIRRALIRGWMWHLNKSVSSNAINRWRSNNVRRLPLLTLSTHELLSQQEQVKTRSDTKSFKSTHKDDGVHQEPGVWTGWSSEPLHEAGFTLTNTFFSLREELNAPRFSGWLKDTTVYRRNSTDISFWSKVLNVFRNSWLCFYILWSTCSCMESSTNTPLWKWAKSPVFSI